MLVYFCERLCFYVVYRIPSADAADTVGVKTERNEKSKAKGYGVAYFSSAFVRLFVRVQFICDHFVIAEFVDLCSK